MIDYAGLWQALADSPLVGWREELEPCLHRALDPANHGDLPHWYATLAALPSLTPSILDLSADCLRIGAAEDIDTEQRALLERLLRDFHPWRKGPFCLFGIHIDTEWRSDWKWNRLAPHLDLRGKTVLDVGGGNGYYGWRMCGAGAGLVFGVDPTIRYVMQYAALSRYIGAVGNYVLPLRFEELPLHSAAFDVAFSMGVLYHRRDPLEHLARLYGQLRPDGVLVLEGLVLEGDELATLHPPGRYAKMKNVHAIPTVPLLRQWLTETGFVDISVLDVSPTTLEEQRRTPWMEFESLADFLDPQDPTRTIEGHPAPRRASLRARRPG
ncbi:MAG: tRNA 5-methoxyuridine(34)/uridine 5-oxyacetic acid(34) synthase CmoB [Thiohalomonadaceae bacterium]